MHEWACTGGGILATPHMRACRVSVVRGKLSLARPTRVMAVGVLLMSRPAEYSRAAGCYARVGMQKHRGQMHNIPACPQHLCIVGIAGHTVLGRAHMGNGSWCAIDEQARGVFKGSGGYARVGPHRWWDTCFGLFIHCSTNIPLAETIALHLICTFHALPRLYTHHQDAIPPAELFPTIHIIDPSFGWFSHCSATIPLVATLAPHPIHPMHYPHYIHHQNTIPSAESISPQEICQIYLLDAVSTMLSLVRLQQQLVRTLYIPCTTQMIYTPSRHYSTYGMNLPAINILDPSSGCFAHYSIISPLAATIGLHPLLCMHYSDYIYTIKPLFHLRN